MDNDENTTTSVLSKVPEQDLLQKSSSEDEEEFDGFEEESESEPEFDCDQWDTDCKIVNVKTDRSVTGYHLMPTDSQDPSESASKKQKIAPQLRTELLDTKFKNNFQDVWAKNEKLHHEGTELIITPFKVCVIDDFLCNSGYLNEIRQEFNDISWNMRNMDLYEFFQSQDLKHLTSHNFLSLLYNFLQNEVMTWVSEITGLYLTHISATCSYYSCTDYLLVHDDQRDDRLVAFILYLTGPEGWDESKGGALQLLDKDKAGQPSQVARNIFPANNQFVFFPVTNDSYHQVAEVTSLYDCRLSINGWFHTKTPPIYQSPKFEPYPDGLYGGKQLQAVDFDGSLDAWITEEYLEQDVIDEIQEYFEQHSEISLKNFMKEESFEELSQILSYGDLSWVKIGPPNRFSYEVLILNDLPVVLDRFLQLFQSNQMFTLLQRFTGLHLHETAATMKFELQKWTPGCYSLLGDYGWETKELDLVITFGCSCNSDVIGARTLYVTTEEQVEDALITLDPAENNLNLIYRDTARFTKYFSKLSRCCCFYTLICCYSE